MIGYNFNRKLRRRVKLSVILLCVFSLSTITGIGYYHQNDQNQSQERKENLTEDLKFNIFTYTHPKFLTTLPSTGKFNPTLNRPYLDPNVDPDIRFYISNITIGTGKVLFAVDAANAFVPFFKIGHVFDGSGMYAV